MAEELRASGISQRFGERVVLDGVDLVVPPGKVLGLLGPNGAGKTTLMRVLFGVLTPDAGTVTWQGRPATDDDRRSWGYMPQERGLYRDMRVLDQLVWIARLHGLDRATSTAKARDLLERLGLGQRATDKVQDLSGGMAQRVQLAAAMVHDPVLLVLDEPFAGLDPVAVGFLSRVILDHVAAGRHLLFSSHQLDLVEDLCETITLIDRGHVVLQGDVRALKAASPDRYLFVDVAVDPAWVDAGQAAVSSVDASGTRLRLRPGGDPGAVLDDVRARATVTSFAVEAPSLSELFLDAAGEGATLDGDTDLPAPVAPGREPDVSNLRGMGLVAGREIREATRRKTFWAVALILLVGATAALIVPEFIDDDGPTRYDVAVVDPAPTLEATLSSVLRGLDAEVRLQELPDAAAARQAVDDGDADVAVLDGDTPLIVVKADEHDELVGAVQQALSLGAVTARLEEAGLTPAEVNDVLSAPPAEIERLDAGEAGRRAAAAVVALVLYLLLLMLMILVANGVAIEKSNRISEVLVSTVRPQALLFGKVIGVGTVGLCTLAFGVMPVVVKLGLGGDLPEGLGGAVAGGAAWFVLGIALYLTLAGSLGTLVERQEEAGSVVTPLTMVLVLSFLVGQSAPDTTLGAVLSIVPLTSPLVMPSRIAMGDASGAEMALSLALGVATVLVVLRVGALVYRRAIVRTGKRLRLRQVLQGT